MKTLQNTGNIIFIVNGVCYDEYITEGKKVVGVRMQTETREREIRNELGCAAEQGHDPDELTSSQ